MQKNTVWNCDSCIKCHSLACREVLGLLVLAKGDLSSLFHSVKIARLCEWCKQRHVAMVSMRMASRVGMHTKRNKKNGIGNEQPNERRGIQSHV
jgi:hypothetical protein